MFADVPDAELSAPADVFVIGDDGPQGVLAAMTREGLVRPVRDGIYLATDRWDVPEGRAAALAAMLGPGLAAIGVVGGLASVWWHLLLADCPVVDVLVPPRVAGGSTSRRRSLHVRGVAVPDVDVIDAGPVRVCTLARAVADVARWTWRPGTSDGAEGADEGAQTVRHVVTLARTAGCSLEEVMAVLDATPRARGTTHARRLLLACDQSTP